MWNGGPRTLEEFDLVDDICRCEYRIKKLQASSNDNQQRISCLREQYNMLVVRLSFLQCFPLDASQADLCSVNRDLPRITACKKVMRVSHTRQYFMENQAAMPVEIISLITDIWLKFILQMLSNAHNTTHTHQHPTQTTQHNTTRNTTRHNNTQNATHHQTKPNTKTIICKSSIPSTIQKEEREKKEKREGERKGEERERED